jgi:hypothetical protein
MGKRETSCRNRLANAGLMQMQARLACTAGRYAEGMALYDEITHALGPMPTRVGSKK